MPQKKRAFLVMYSQADMSIFKDCESFAKAVVKAMGSCHVVEWACCKEFHKDRGEHFHMPIRFISSRLWGPVKKTFLHDYVSLHFQTKSYGYVTVYRYIIKEEDISTVLHCQGHTPLECIDPQRQKKLLIGSTRCQVRKRKES